MQQLSGHGNKCAKPVCVHTFSKQVLRVVHLLETAEEERGVILQAMPEPLLGGTLSILNSYPHK
jgi:hypothetical protein